MPSPYYQVHVNRWLDTNMYRRIHRKAKKLGAQTIDTKHLFHKVYFEHVDVAFAFRPFEYSINLRRLKPLKCEELDAVKADLDRAQEFVKYLKDFSENVVDKVGPK